MNVVTIPKKLTSKGELIVIPKQEYRAFEEWKKKVRVRLDEQWFWTPEWQKKEAEADAAIRDGKISILFEDHRKLVAALKKKQK